MRILIMVVLILLEPFVAYLAWEGICVGLYGYPSVPFPVIVVVSFTASLFTSQHGIPVDDTKMQADYQRSLGHYVFYMAMTALLASAVQWAGL